MKILERVIGFVLVLLLFGGIFLQQQTIEEQEARIAALEARPVSSREFVITDAAAFGYESAAVVNIYETVTMQTTENTFLAEPEVVTGKSLVGQASGVVVGEGLVLTCWHITDGREYLTVSIPGGEEIDARVLREDPIRDLALLEAPGLGGTAAVIGSSAGLRIGQPVVCVASPASQKLTGTVTFGVISGVDRIMGSLKDPDQTVRVFQMDAAINGGSSGGGVYDLRGELVGIVTRKYISTGSSDTQLEGIGMCIPIDEAKELLNP